MTRLGRIVRTFPLAVFAFLPAVSYAAYETPISTGRYVTGGILGCALGFGIGHAVQKRYVPLGLVFTVGESAAWLATILDAGIDTYDEGNGVVSTRFRIGAAGIVGLSVMVGLRVWEILDVWISGAKHMRRATGSEPVAEPQVSVLPISGTISTPGMSVLVRF